MRGSFKGRVLVVEDRVPYPAMGAGYPRAAALLLALVQEGWFVTLYPLLFPEGQWEKVYAAFPRQIEVMLGAGEDRLAGFLKARAGYYDTIIVSRPHNMRIFLDKGGAGAGGRLIYDAEAVFAAREFLRLALAGTPVSAARQKAELRQEMQLAEAADRVVTVSARESAYFTGRRLRIGEHPGACAGGAPDAGRGRGTAGHSVRRRPGRRSLAQHRQPAVVRGRDHAAAGRPGRR